MSADPNLVPNARQIPKVSVHEMFALSQGGAKIVRAEALKFKTDGMRLRIASFDSPSIAEGGTEIEGVFDSRNAEVNMRYGFEALTIIGDMNAGMLGHLFSTLSDRNVSVWGVSTGVCSLTVFVEGLNQNGLKELHDTGRFKAMSVRKGVGMLAITHPEFVHSPGYVSKVSNILASKNINIIEVTTDKATINVFVDEMELKIARRVISDGLQV